MSLGSLWLLMYDNVVYEGVCGCVCVCDVGACRDDVGTCEVSAGRTKAWSRHATELHVVVV